MPQFIQKHIDLKLAKLCVILSVLFNLFFNSTILLSKKLTGINAAYNLLPDVLYLTIILFILLWGFGIHRKLFVIGALILFLSGAFASFHMFFFGIFPTISVMKKFWGSGIDDILKVFDIRLIAWLVFSGFVCIYTIRSIGGSETTLFFSKLLSAFCLVLSINGIIAPSHKILTSYFPGAYLHNSYLLLSK
jgi:glucan phosphoethanolaminetransferase (alkaline phosphatase superfamily)